MPSLAAVLAILLVLTASAADAKTWFTAPVGVEVGQEAACVVQNLDRKPHSVSVTVYGSSGELIASSPDFPVAPGEVSSPASAGPGFGSYCAFEGLSRTVRGFVAVREGNATLLELPAER